MKCVSLYSGADNLGDGVIQAGHEIILAVEYNPDEPKLGKDACETIKLNHPDIEVINKPVSEVLTTLPRCDCVVGGPPCPEFSNAKHDKTFDLCEVNNFKKAIEITKAKYHFMENVPLLSKVYKQRNFLINCADYGVPQTRVRRIFTNLQLPKRTHSEFPSESLFGKPIKKWVSVKDALGLNGIIQDRKITYGSKEWREYSTDKPSHVIHTDTRDWFVNPTGFDKKNEKQISRSINEPIMTIVVGNSYQFTDKPKFSKKYKQFKNEFEEIRKIINKELAILQGFRSDFKFYGGKSSVGKQIGNALPAIISRRFFELII